MKYKWKESIDVSHLWELMNRLDPDIKFNFENEQLIAFLAPYCSNIVMTSVLLLTEVTYSALQPLPSCSTITILFIHVRTLLQQITNNEYDNIILIGDLNTKSKSNSYYSDLYDTFDLTNLIKANTFKPSNQTDFVSFPLFGLTLVINWEILILKVMFWLKTKKMISDLTMSCQTVSDLVYDIINRLCWVVWLLR